MFDRVLNTSPTYDNVQTRSNRAFSVIYTVVFVFYFGRYQDYFFWIPVVAQLLGGVTGAFVYIFAIELHHPDMLCETKKPEEHVQQNPYL